jgi:hypothetical protein
MRRSHLFHFHHALLAHTFASLISSYFPRAHGTRHTYLVEMGFLWAMVCWKPLMGPVQRIYVYICFESDEASLEQSRAYYKLKAFFTYSPFCCSFPKLHLIHRYPSKGLLYLEHKVFIEEIVEKWSKHKIWRNAKNQVKILGLYR